MDMDKTTKKHLQNRDIFNREKTKKICCPYTHMTILIFRILELLTAHIVESKCSIFKYI